MYKYKTMAKGNAATHACVLNIMQNDSYIDLPRLHPE